MERLKCTRCGYEWTPRDNRVPKRCANVRCQRPNYIIVLEKDKPISNESPYKNLELTEEVSAELKEEQKVKLK